MPKTIGIDLGTTNSCVAYLEAGLPHVLTNAEGGRTTPSVVAWTNDGETLVGAAARRQAVTNPHRTVASIKRFMGRKNSEVSEEQAIVPYELESGQADAVRVRIDERQLAPEEISALILGKLKRDAEAVLGEEVTGAVITVPAYFNDAQRQATKDAGKIAGLEVKRLVNEPTAAALAYGLNGDHEQKVLVFDLGGGTFDVSVLDISDGVFEVLATAGDNHLGGDDFDKAIVDWMTKRFAQQTGIDLQADAMALQRLYEAAEKAKIELSATQKTSIHLPFITANAQGPQHLELTLEREEMTDIAASLLERLDGPMLRAIEAAGIDVVDLDQVLLVGGMTRMPAVVERVRRLSGIEPTFGVNPDEAVAMGAAVQGGVLEGSVSDVLLLDVTPLTLGIETKGGLTAKLIEANTTIPTKATEVFTTGEDNQSSVDIHIVQGERELARDNRSLGKIQLREIRPAPANVPQIEVSFELSADGILRVEAIDLDTDKHAELSIEASTGLAPEEVERMRAEAADNSDADQAARRLVQLRNSAEALRNQAARALREHAEETDAAASARLTAAIEAVNSALSQPRLQEASLREIFVDLEQAVDEFMDEFEDDLDADDPEALGQRPERADGPTPLLVEPVADGTVYDDDPPYDD